MRGNLVVQGRPLRLISERDVYRLVMRSKLPSAEAFEEWVVAKVLPAIRKNGRYEAPRQEEPKRNALATALEGIGGALIELKEDIDAARESFAMGLPRRGVRSNACALVIYVVPPPTPNLRRGPRHREKVGYGVI